MRTLAATLALLLLAPLVASAREADQVLIPVRGRLTPAEVDAIVRRIDPAVERGVRDVVLEFQVEDRADESGLDLAAALSDLAPDVRVTGLVTARAPGSAVAVLLACDRALATADATLGPVPPTGPVHDAVVRAARERGLPRHAADGLLPVSLGGGVLDAETARKAGFFERVFADRDSALAHLGFGAARSESARVTVDGPFENAFVVPIVGEIDDTLAASVRRRVGHARAQGADLVIFDVDSPGGLVSSSMEIGDFIFSLPIPAVMLVMGGGEYQGAFSGAALITLGGNEIIMGVAGHLGDCQPIAMSPGGYEVLGEKIQSPLRAVFRKYAERNGYPVHMAEAMITQELEVHRVTFGDGHIAYLLPEEIDAAAKEHSGVRKNEIVVRKDELLTMTATAAEEFGFCGPLVKDRDEAFARLGLERTAVPVLEETWAEKASRFLLAIKGLLFFVGIIALYMELKAPGLGLPGAIALICFALFFSASAVAGISTGVEVILFVLGVFLLAVELILIPGFGVPGIAGIVLILASLYMASVKFGLPDLDRPWEVRVFLNWGLQLSLAFLGSFLVMLVLARILPKTSIGRKLILAPAGPAGALGLTGSGSPAGRRAAALAGRHGRALTNLRPAGRIEVDGEPWDAVTDGDFVERGADVQVSEVKGNRIVVRKA